MHLHATCPYCKKALRIPESLLGQSVKCPSCQNTFTTAEQEPVVTATRPARIRPNSEFSSESPRRASDVDDLDNRPRRRSRRRSDDFDEETDFPRRPSRRARAKEAVLAPGIALLAIGILGLIYGLWNAAWVFGGHDVELKHEDAAFRFGAYAATVVQVIWGIFATTGGVCMVTFKLRPL